MKDLKIPVLLIDDDIMIATILSDYLSGFDFELSTCQHSEQGVKMLEQQHFAILLLDIILPTVSGFDVCRQIRKSNDIPIIMLTSKDAVNDKVQAFEYGADDYLAKPFEPRELVARMQRLLQRHEPAQRQTNLPDIDVFKIDSNKRQVVINDATIDLTAIEFDILTLLYNQPGVVFDRNKILQHVKGFTEDVTLQTRAIDNSISRLRRKLETQSGKQQLIRTVWGQGYSFAEQAI